MLILRTTTLPLLFCLIPYSTSWISPRLSCTDIQRISPLRLSNNPQQPDQRKKRRSQKKNIDDMVNFIDSPQSGISIDPNSFPKNPPEKDEPLATFVKSIVKAADMRKAEDIRAIRVSKITAVTSFVVVVSGNSRPQNQAISMAITKEVEEVHGRRLRNEGVPEGTADSGWILLDYGDVMVHIMTPRSRLFYDIEGQWKKGEDMDLSEVLVPNVVEGGDGGSGGMGLDEEDDPFWS